jgi:hypothetical protein
MKNYTIGITTFKRRIESVKSMVEYIRSCDEDIVINLAVNGEVEEDFDEEYRKQILELCIKHKNIFPFFYQEFRALSKLWNNIVISSKTEYNLILNDDLVFDNSVNFVHTVNDIILNNPEVKCFTINGSWSHFVITREFLDEMNYFDERFLLHGEEDGDFVWRYIEKYGGYPPSINLGIANKHQTGQKDETMITNNTDIGYANKPRFNQEFTVTKYQQDPSSTISGLYGKPHKKILQDERQYPYESFYLKNKNGLKKFKGIEL